MKPTQKIFLSLLIIFSQGIYAQQSFTITFDSITAKSTHHQLKGSTVAIENDIISNAVDLYISKSSKYKMLVLFVPGLPDSTEIKVYHGKSNKELGSLIYTLADEWKYIKVITRNKEDGMHLSEGLNTIRFEISGYNVPIIDDLILEEPKTFVLTSTKQHTIEKYIEDLQENKLLFNKEKTYESDDLGNSPLTAQSEPVFDYTPPVYKYDYRENINFNYTWYYTYYLEAGTTLTYETTNNNCDPVMYFFNKFNPSAGSWFNDDGGVELNSKLTVIIPTSGFYTLLLRSYNSDNPGTVRLLRNGQTIVQSAPVAGRFHYQSSTKNGLVLNHFTAHTTGNPYLWINQGARVGAIVAENSQYVNPNSGFIWNLNARIETNNTIQANKGFLVSAFSISNPTGVCDLYMNAEYATSGISGFPNLKSIDALKSDDGGFQNRYNCHAWAGGISSTNLNPYKDYSTHPWFEESEQSLNSFDNYFGNNPPRYAGAMTYERGNEENAAIAVMAFLNINNNSISQFTHSMVRKPANNHMHGYEWESKDGLGPRFMHPKYALYGPNPFGQPGYGAIVAYYKPTGTFALTDLMKQQGVETGLTFEQSVNMGFTLIEDISLSEAEMEYVQNQRAMHTNIEPQIKRLLNSWKKELAQESIPTINPDTLSPNYLSLKKLCIENFDKAFPVIVYDFVKNDNAEADYKFLYDITKERYSPLFREVLQENLANQFNTNGQFIFRSTQSNYIKYIKKIMNHIMDSSFEKQGTILHDELMIIAPNPAQNYVEIKSLSDIEVTSVIVYGIDYSIIKSIKTKSKVIRIDTSSWKSRMYYVQVTFSDGNTLIKPLLKSR